MSVETIHASCVLIGETGILIRGPSGSGKSTLARGLLDQARQMGRWARLVGDDRVAIEACHGRLVARGHPEIAGRLELRGVGLFRVDHEPAMVVRLVVDCLSEPESRLPEPFDTKTTLCGVTLPRLGQRSDSDAPAKILWRIGDLNDTLMAL